MAGVLEARRLLEPRVAQLAAVHASEEDFAAMAKLIERKRELAASRRLPRRHEDLFLQLDLKFHLAMARATRNSTVVRPDAQRSSASSRSPATWPCTRRSCPTG